MREYLISPAIDFGFKQSVDEFFVEEIPARRFGQKGRFSIIKVKKRNLSTWDLLSILGRSVPKEQIGYAGLKDKNATTIQYISFPSKYEHALRKFSHPKVEILEKKRSNMPLKIGDLAGNRFSIVIKRIDAKKISKLHKALDKIAKKGMPNYFGYQRFGQKSLDQARALIDGDFFTRDKKLEKMLLFAYQSDLFNKWLAERVRMSQDGNFRLLRGDVYIQDEKLFTPKEIPLEDFLAKKVMVTGLLPGSKAFRARGEAAEIEERYDEPLPLKGGRRPALVYPKEISLQPDGSQATLGFVLPKGSYATSLLENLASKNIDHKGLA